MFKKMNIWWMLPIGAIVIALTHMRFGIGFLAWVGYAPLLIFLKKKEGIGARVIVFSILTVAWTIATFKIITPPIPWFFALLFSPIIASFHFGGILVWDIFKKKPYHFLIFPAAMMIFEWIMYTFTPFASWGAAAYTQVDYPAIVQSVSLFGMMGLSFLIYLINMLFALWYDSKPFKLTVIAGAALILLVCYGHLRIGFAEREIGSTVQVAAVGSTSNIKEVGIPEEEKRLQVQRELFERTRNASIRGVMLVVWPEGATLVYSEEEAAWKAKLQELALETNADIVAGYLTVNRPFDGTYKNKYVFITASGLIDHEYHKHHPVVGEPTIKGTEKLKVVERSYGQVSGAICYDYDYPRLALKHGRLGADIVALPSNDWMGINPIHTQMASLRAVENGFSIIRSAQFGLTAAIGPYGGIYGKYSDFNSEEKVLVAEIPNRKVWTLFSVIGEVTVIAVGAFVLLGGIILKKKEL